jgi:hypothetical protein
MGGGDVFHVKSSSLLRRSAATKADRNKRDDGAASPGALDQLAQTIRRPRYEALRWFIAANWPCSLVVACRTTGAYWLKFRENRRAFATSSNEIR